MGVRRSENGYGNREGFLFVGFLFSSSYGTLRSMTVERYLPFVPDNSNLFTILSLTLQPIQRTATARLAVGTTFHHGNLVNLI